MATLSSADIGSGLDVNGIVTQLMALEKQPLALLSSQQDSFKTQLSAVGQMQSALSAFQTAAKGLTTATAATPYKANSADTSVFTASTSSTAVAGNYSIAITQLARAQKIVATGVADKTAAIGSGA